MTTSREALRARVFLRAVLPLLEVMKRQPAASSLFRTAAATVQLEVQDAPGVGAALCVRGGAFCVEQGVQAQAEVRCVFRDLRGLNSFFAGKLALPRLIGLRHPRLIVDAVRLLSSLRILHPQPPPKLPADRALRVRLLLYLVTAALAELHRGGHAEMVELVASSPERVYQWTVGDEGVAFLRMHRGRVMAGRGTWTQRRPFVHFVFPDVDACLAVLTATESQMAGVRGGRMLMLGSPEYTRKIGLMMQKVDELLQEG